MSSEIEFRRNAEECTKRALSARNKRERAIYLQLAKEWLQAAGLTEEPPETMEERLAVTTLPPGSTP